MSIQQISITEFLACIDELHTKSVPLIAVFASTDNAVSRLFGFSDGATAEHALVFSSTQGTPRASSNIKVPVPDGSTFFREVSADLAAHERESCARNDRNVRAADDFHEAQGVLDFFVAPSVTRDDGDSEDFGIG